MFYYCAFRDMNLNHGGSQIDITENKKLCFKSGFCDLNVNKMEKSKAFETSG